MSKPRLPWLRLYERIIDDEKILMLAKEDRWNFITLLCLKRRGVLENTDPRLRLRMIATKMGLTVAEAEESIRRMAEVSLTDERGDPLRHQDYCAFTANDARPPAHEWRVIRERIFARDDYTCTYCGVRGVRLECDHVSPVALGGTHDDENLTTACRACNRAKRSKTVEDWMSAV